MPEDSDSVKYLISVLETIDLALSRKMRRNLARKARAERRRANKYGRGKETARRKRLGKSRLSLAGARCATCGTANRLHRHHLDPTPPKKLKGNVKNEIALCHTCHTVAHSLWGPGDNYEGPRTAVYFVPWLLLALAYS